MFGRESEHAEDNQPLVDPEALFGDLLGHLEHEQDVIMGESRTLGDDMDQFLGLRAVEPFIQEPLRGLPGPKAPPGAWKGPRGRLEGARGQESASGEDSLDRCSKHDQS